MRHLSVDYISRRPPQLIQRAAVRSSQGRECASGVSFTPDGEDRSGESEEREGG